jgi:head-tail adaptor
LAWTPPGAGALRDRITIESKLSTSDGMGGTTDAWEAVLTSIPAKIVGMRGGEAVQALRLSGTAPFEVTIRATQDTASITSGDRIIVSRSGQRLNVQWVGSLEEGRKAWLLLTCIAGEVANG